MERGFRFNDRRRFTIVENEFFSLLFVLFRFFFFWFPISLSFSISFNETPMTTGKIEWLPTREGKTKTKKNNKTKNTTKSTDWFIKKENKGKQLRNVEIGGGGAWEKNFLTTVAPFITLVRERWVVSRLSGLWPNQRRPMKQKKNETK